MAASNPSKYPVLPPTNNTPRVIRKRVGGGFKYVVEMTEEKDSREKGKEEMKYLEKAEEEHRGEKSPADSFESISLPQSTNDLRRDVVESADKVLYNDYPILRYIQNNVIGHNIAIDGPFGLKRVIYCDYTASGRSLSFIEDYIRTFVCPFYANTHSETGRNARQTSKFREEARDIIRQCTNCGKDDVVIFTGSGATAGLHKMAWGLKINIPRVAEETVVLTGPYEHHANMLLWKEFGTTVVRIRDTPDGQVDLEHLASELKFWKEKKRQVLVCFSAASNVTGIVTDTDAVSELAHAHGAFVGFDYAGGGPYLKIDMNASKKGYKDAVFISPHKFVGGPGSPGIMIAKKWMFRNQVPDRVGGGTVVYVTRETHAYTSDIEAREEGGTPAIIESIRTGLAFQLKKAVGENLIEARDDDLCKRAFEVWEQNPALVVLGSHTAKRVTIFSFVVRHVETGKFVHYNFISNLLNDLFGIQSRGGCACAGPYSHDLLGISEPMAKRLKWFTNEQIGMDPSCPQYPMGIMRPGFVRVNLPYFYDDETCDYIINAVDLVATHGWKLLPQYTFNIISGSFTYKGTDDEEHLFSLRDLDYNHEGEMHVNRHPPAINKNISLQAMLRDGKQTLQDATENTKARKSSATRKLLDLIPKDKRKLRWFLTPQEVSDLTTGARRIKPFRPIFNPKDDANRDSDTDSPLNTYRSTVSNQNTKITKRRLSEQIQSQKSDQSADRPYKNVQNLEIETQGAVRNKDLNPHVRRLSEIPRGLRNSEMNVSNPYPKPRKKRDLSLPRLT